MQESDLQSERPEVEKGGGGWRQWWSFGLLVLTAALLLTVMLGARAAARRADPSSTADDDAATASAAPQDYGRFSHTSPGAHTFSSPGSCGDCHQRRGTQPTLPGHKACINCHLAQFTTVNIPMCTICHVNDLGNPNPGLKGFPRLRSFRVSFDHQQHVRIGASCTGCHKPTRRGVALTAPVDASAHAQCYTCHSPGSSASNLSSCGTCHTVGGYALSTPGARAYSAGFSHATHGPRQGLTACTRCHNVLGSGLPPSRQVTSPTTAQHFPKSRAQSCVTCHNDKPVFGDSNFRNCKQCHKGATFRMGG